MAVLRLCQSTNSNEHFKSVTHLLVTFKSHPSLILCNHLFTTLHKHLKSQLNNHQKLTGTNSFDTHLHLYCFCYNLFEIEPDFTFHAFQDFTLHAFQLSCETFAFFFFFLDNSAIWKTLNRLSTFVMHVYFNFPFPFFLLYHASGVLVTTFRSLNLHLLQYILSIDL